MKVRILRGLPGSGKSRWVSTLQESNSSCVVCSADDFHMIDGEYRFNPAHIGAAHNACLGKFLTWIMEDAESLPEYLVVDNTNTQAWEIAPYYRLAETLGFDVSIVRIECDFSTACRRNVHGVPAARIWQMYQNLLSERLPAHWREEIVLP